MTTLSFVLLAPIFLTPSEEGPAVVTPDGLAWHQLEAKAQRDFTVPRTGQLVLLVRRLDPKQGPETVKVAVTQGETAIWETALKQGRGTQLGGVVAGRAQRGTSKEMVQQGVITVNVPDEGHAGVLVQIELIPDLGEPAQDAATARLEAGANPSATPALKAPQPALIQPGTPEPTSGAITVAKAAVPPQGTPIAAAPAAPAASTPEANPALPPAADEVMPAPASASKKPLPVSGVDGGVGFRQAVGGIMQSNASFRLGTDLRQELLPNIKMGLELRLSFLGAQGNAAIPMAGMVSTSGVTTREVQVSGWSLPVLVRLTQAGNSALQTILLVGPAFGGLSVTPGSRAAQSHSLAGLAGIVRLQPKEGIALGPTQLRIGAELGWQGLWSDKVSASRGFVGVDLGFPWSL